MKPKEKRIYKRIIEALKKKGLIFKTASSDIMKRKTKLGTVIFDLNNGCLYLERPIGNLCYFHDSKHVNELRTFEELEQLLTEIQKND